MGALLDCVFPTEEAIPAAQATILQAREAEELKKVEDSKAPERIADAYDKLLADESERLKSVEGRLASILGLTSLTATLLISGTMALLSGSLADSSGTVRVLAALGAFYLSLQIICSTLAAVRGLARTTWLRPTIDDLVPDEANDLTLTNRERALNACKRYQGADRNINTKVTQVAIAHTAIRNFAVGSVTIAFLGLFAVLLQQPGNATANAIRKDTDLQKLLRGPVGPAGPTGPPGPPSYARPPEEKASNRITTTTK